MKNAKKTANDVRIGFPNSDRLVLSTVFVRDTDSPSVIHYKRLTRWWRFSIKKLKLTKVVIPEFFCRESMIMHQSGCPIKTLGHDIMWPPIQECIYYFVLLEAVSIISKSHLCLSSSGFFNLTHGNLSATEDKMKTITFCPKHRAPPSPEWSIAVMIGY